MPDNLSLEHDIRFELRKARHGCTDAHCVQCLKAEADGLDLKDRYSTQEDCEACDEPDCDVKECIISD